MNVVKLEGKDMLRDYRYSESATRNCAEQAALCLPIYNHTTTKKMNEDQPSKGGRPLKPKEEKRSKVVTIKLTEAEYKEVKKRADTAGVKLSEYVRHGSFRLTIVSRLNEEEKKIAQGILHLGSDFNQAVKWMNTLQSRVALKKLHKVIDGMFYVLYKLRPKQETEYVGKST